MTIDTSSLFTFLDRFGLPTVYLGVLAWLAWRIITGPLMVLARAGVEYLQGATASLNKTQLDHVELGARADAGVATIKAHVTAEGAAMRSHLDAAVTSLHTRVETTKSSIETTVRQTTGEHRAYVEPPPSRASAPTLPSQDSRGGA